MKYISTRNNSKEYSFKQVFIKGLADDGGLFIPKSLKKFSNNELNSLSKLSYQDLAKKISMGKMNKFKEENALLTQAWVMEPKKKVKDVINEISKKDKIKVKNFIRFKVGEGL